jgi:hypothetical protein
VIAFCWREPGAEICTAGICVDCARHDDATLVEMSNKRCSLSAPRACLSALGVVR